jgi:DNA-binding NtrC family response regulator
MDREPANPVDVRLVTSRSDAMESRSEGGTVLVVVGDESRGRGIVAALDEAGFCPLFVTDASKAMAFLEAATFDVVAADEAMPGGPALLEHVRVRRPQTEVVLLGDRQRLVAAVREALTRARDRRPRPVDAAGRHLPPTARAAILGPPS